MNRRAFLKRFGIGITAALALASLPAEALDGLTLTDAGQYCACEYLRKVYNAYAKGRPISESPRRMEAGRALFTAYEGEVPVILRFSAIDSLGPRNLRFKCAQLDCVGEGWIARVVA